MTQQFFFLLADRFRGVVHASMEDVAFETLFECVSAARSCNKANRKVMGIYAVDMETGNIEQIHNWHSAMTMFSNMDECEDRYTPDWSASKLRSFYTGSSI